MKTITSKQLVAGMKEEPKTKEVNRTLLRKEMEEGFDEVIIKLSKKYFGEIDSKDLMEYLGSTSYTSARHISDMIIAKLNEKK